MSLKVNMLETHQDIEDYKSWLGTKPMHFLKYLEMTFNRNQKREKPSYPNLPLRIELVKNEIERRNKDTR